MAIHKGNEQANKRSVDIEVNVIGEVAAFLVLRSYFLMCETNIYVQIKTI